MENTRFAIQNEIRSSDLKRVRKKLNMTQKEFANLIGISKPTIERWEASSDSINGPIVLLLNMIENNYEYIKKIEINKKELPLRMFYMYKNKYCTQIEVDNLNRKVKIKNYVDNIMFRAFGINENPTYEEYESFLRSRCFPETRDKLKLVLEDLGLPFYDPFLIIKKTEGRMAEDDFWIKLED